MTKQEIEDKYFHEFLVWCATAPPDGAASRHLVFWLDHGSPTSENFWEWYVEYKAQKSNGYLSKASPDS